MEIKSLRYSNRGGYSVEWFDPGSLRLSLYEVCCILMLLTAGLSEEEMIENFKKTEREIIYRYIDLYHKTYVKRSEIYSEMKSVKKLHQEMKKKLSFWEECVRAGPREVCEALYKWKMPKDAWRATPPFSPYIPRT